MASAETPDKKNVGTTTHEKGKRGREIRALPGFKGELWQPREKKLRWIGCEKESLRKMWSIEMHHEIYLLSGVRCGDKRLRKNRKGGEEAKPVQEEGLKKYQGEIGLPGRSWGGGDPSHVISSKSKKQHNRNHRHSLPTQKKTAEERRN